MFEQSKKDGIHLHPWIERGCLLYGELVFDVNTAYFP